MADFKVAVKSWMLKKSTENFRFMANYNNDIPMPLMVMYTGGVIDETKGMVKMSLHGDIKERVTTRCMACGRELKNPVSQFFGIGPECGGHGYVNPFNSEEELNAAVARYREKLINTVWTGWIAKSAITAINDNTDIQEEIDSLPIEITTDPVTKMTDTVVPSAPTIIARVDKPVKCTDDFSVFLSFKYDQDIIAKVKALRAKFWDKFTKEWEIEYKELGELQLALPTVEFQLQNDEILPRKLSIPEDYKFKTKPMKHQVEGIQYGLDHSRFLLGDSMGLGKSKQAIDLAVIRKHLQGFRHCLVICGVNSLKWNWLEEIEKHSNEGAYLLGQHMMPRRHKLSVKGSAAKLADLGRLD